MGWRQTESQDPRWMRRKFVSSFVDVSDFSFVPTNGTRLSSRSWDTAATQATRRGPEQPDGKGRAKRVLTSR